MAYKNQVIDHFENPRNVGTLNKDDPNVGTGLVGAPACGDVMRLQIKVDDEGTIKEAKFKTFGCVVSNTKINTPTKIQKVSELSVGSPVLAWNGNTIVENKVANIQERLVDKNDLLVIKLKRETSRKGINPLPLTLITTKDHIFWLAKQKPIEANNLKAGDELFEITEFELRRLTNIRHRKEFRKKLSNRMVEFNKFFDHSKLPQNQKGYVHSVEFRKKLSESSKKMWQNDKYVKNWQLGMSKIDRTRTTSVEREFKEFFKSHDIPVKYSAGKVWIQTDFGPKSPDFVVPGKQKVIEVYTKKMPLFMEDRSDSSFYREKRKQEFESAGFDTLCLAIEDISNCLEEIQSFVHNGMKIISVEPITHGNQLKGCEKKKDKIVVYDISLEEGANVMFYNRVASHNCGSAIASSSLITEWVKNKKIEDAEKITNQEIVEELSLPPVKVHCSVLAEDAIKAAINDYRQKRDK